MKYIEVDEELYRHIASKTVRIGESASDILRRELGLSTSQQEQSEPESISQPSMETVVESSPNEPIVATQETSEVEPAADVALSDICFDNLFSPTLLMQQKGAVGKFLFALESVHQLMGEKFEKILQIQGRDRLYFAKSKEALLKASPSANPKQIGESQYWVTSNNNTAKKRTILKEVLLQFGCDETIAKSLAEQALPL